MSDANEYGFPWDFALELAFEPCDDDEFERELLKEIENEQIR